MTFCLQGIEEMCFLPTQFKTVSESDDCIEFAGCRRGGSQLGMSGDRLRSLFQVWYHIAVLLAMIFLFHNAYLYHY